MKTVKSIVILLFLGSTILFSCGENSRESSETIHGIEDLKTKQYAINGKVLYENLCANCHQEDGRGLGNLIPPLAASDYMLADIGRTVRIIKFGQEGEITVNGIQYNQPMPANPQLTPPDIAEIATYIYNVWGNREGLISAGEVRKYLREE